MRHLSFALCLWVSWPGVAFANNPPAPPAYLATLSIVPLALLFFVLSGAAAYYDGRDREKHLDFRLAGWKRWIPVLIFVLIGIVETPLLPPCLALYVVVSDTRRPSSRRQRLWALGVATLAAVLTGVQEGAALLTAPILGFYALCLGGRMFRIPGDTVLSVPVWVPRLAAVALIPATVFLAGFSWAFLNSYRYVDSAHRKQNVLESMRIFSTYQKRYAAAHRGIYRNILPTRYQDVRDDSEKKVLQDSGALSLGDAAPWGTRTVTVTYGPGFRTYEMRVVPQSFLIWPYNYLSPRFSFYMDQRGIIRQESMTGPGPGASIMSPVVK